MSGLFPAPSAARASRAARELRIAGSRLSGSRKLMRISKPNCIYSLKRRRYGAILADPPWSFRNWSAKGTGRNAVSHYDCLDFPALASLPIANLAADDCVLFMWATDPLLPRAFELIEAWGFE